MELVTQTINSLTLGSDDDGTASNGADIENGRGHGGGHGSSHDHGRPRAGTGLAPSAPLVSARMQYLHRQHRLPTPTANTTANHPASTNTKHRHHR